MIPFPDVSHYFVNIKEDTPEWYEFRNNHIGASDSPIIMNVSPWRKKHELLLEKINSISPQKETYYMRRGKTLEAEALSVFEMETNCLMTKNIVKHPTIEYIMASLDGISLDGSVCLEIKCPGKKDHRIGMEGKVPEKYFPQLQHQLEVTRCKKMFYMTYDELTWNIIEVYRDDDYISALLKAEKEFWDSVLHERKRLQLEGTYGAANTI